MELKTRKMRYILISNGDFESETARKIDWDSSVKVCVDGGARHFKELGIDPDVIIGDLDSADQETVEYFKNRGVEVLKHPSKKDKTDTEIAVEYAVENGATEILLLGSTGSRVDHMMGNINLLHKLKTQYILGKMIDSVNEISIISGDWELERDESYKYISLIPYGGEVKGVTLRGFEYELTERDFSASDILGISNEMNREKAHISIGSGEMLLIKSK